MQRRQCNDVGVHAAREKAMSDQRPDDESDPEELGSLSIEDDPDGTVDPEELAGGRTAQESAKLFVDVLEGRGTRPQRDVVTANAALAISCLEPGFSFSDCLATAQESLESGRARQALRELVAVTHSHATTL